MSTEPAPLIEAVAQAEGAAEAPLSDSTGARVASWLALTAPGVLLSWGLVLLALIVVPLLTPLVYAEAAVRWGAALLLLAHIVSAVLMLRRPGGAVATIWCALLATEAVLCGVVMSAQPQLRGLGVPVGVVALAVGTEAGGWLGVMLCAWAVAVGAAVGVWLDVGTPLVFVPAPVFSSVLSVETRFGEWALGQWTGGSDVTSGPMAVSAARLLADVLATAGSEAAFPSQLTVETSFAGASGMHATGPLFVPALALALVAVGAGAAVNLVRARGVRPRETVRAVRL
jgi:hypothetical protein